MSPNMLPINNSTLFGSSNDTRSHQPPANPSDRGNSILGIGGNLPNLNLPQNGPAPGNPPGATTTNNTNNISARPSIANVDSPSPLPPLTNMFRRASDITTSTATRPVAVPHTRRGRSEISPFIPRKPYPPNRIAAVPRKRPEPGSNETVNRENPLPDSNEAVNRGNSLFDSNSTTARANPLTSRPYQENTNIQGNASQSYNINPFNPPVLHLPQANSSNDSDIVDLTSD